MLISEIISDAIGDVGGDTTDSELVAHFLRFTKSALRRFPRWCRGRLIRTKKSGTLSAAATTMTLPSGTRGIQEVFYQDSNGKRIEILMPGVVEFNRQYAANESGPPQYCIIRGTEVEFSRKADAAYTIYFDCQGEISSVSSGDTWAYSEDEVEILKDGIKFYYYSYKEDDTQQVNFAKLFKDGLDSLDADHVREGMPDHVEEAD